MSYYNSSRFQTDGEGRYEQMTNHGCLTSEKEERRITES